MLDKHRIRLILKPDSELAQAKETAEKQQLARIKEALSEEQKETIIASATALKQRQEMTEDLDILPKVGISDIPKESSSEPVHANLNPFLSPAMLQAPMA